MVSYQKVQQEDIDTTLRRTDDIELNNIDSSSREELLSSFERVSLDDDDDEFELEEEDEIITCISKNSDDRLFSNHQENEIHRSIQSNIAFNNSNSANLNNNLNNIDNNNDNNNNNSDNSRLLGSTSTSDSNQHVLNSPISNPQPPTSSSFRYPITIHSIRKHFNFLDRLFQKKYTPGERIGEGFENDGVFSNLSAKPDLNPQVESDKPPTYEEAAADSTPPYWENSVLAPGFGEEVFIDGLPVGNVINFAWNLLVSASFQFVGFLLTYILHTSHAAKHGSRAGLGVTFVTYGFNLIPNSKSYDSHNSKIANSKIEPTDANSYDVGTDNKIEGTLDNFHSSLSSGSDPVVEESSSDFMAWLAYGVILFGLLIIVKALFNYRRAKKMEDTILQPPATSVISSEDQV